MIENNEFNKELLLVRDFLEKEYKKYIMSNCIKSEEERLIHAHALQTVSFITENCDIKLKK